MSEKCTRLEAVAAICHEANRAYCLHVLGDDSHESWLGTAKEIRLSMVRGVAHILLSDASPEDLHKYWIKDKKKNGWKFGEKKDVEKKEHPCLVSWSKLPEEEKRKDRLFHAIVRSFVGNLIEKDTLLAGVDWLGKKTK